MADRNFDRIRWLLMASLLLLFGLAPLLATAIGQPYYLTLIARMMIYGMAAMALNFILGFGGMASLGHALYLGIGSYAVSLLQYHGVINGWIQLFAAMVVGILFAGCIGAVVTRMSGMSFIMITLAFAQMGYFLAISLRQYGGEDGRSIESRSTLAPLDLSDKVSLYYVIFAALLGTLWILSRMVHSKFGMVLRGCMQNERRMLALGFSTHGYKVVAYMISSLLVVISGFMLANLTAYASPAYFQWTVSADLVIMALLGGTATVFGPLLGAIVYLLLEELLTSFKPGWFPSAERMINEYWLALMGAFIILVVLTSRKGIFGHFARRQ